MTHAVARGGWVYISAEVAHIARRQVHVGHMGLKYSPNRGCDHGASGRRQQLEGCRSSSFGRAAAMLARTRAGRLKANVPKVREKVPEYDREQLRDALEHLVVKSGGSLKCSRPLAKSFPTLAACLAARHRGRSKGLASS